MQVGTVRILCDFFVSVGQYLINVICHCISNFQDTTMGLWYLNVQDICCCDHQQILNPLEEVGTYSARFARETKSAVVSCIGSRCALTRFTTCS